MSKVTYEPISAKEALRQIRDICSILVDLAYTSVLFEDKALAEEVGDLRDLVIRLDYLLNMSLQVAVRDGKDAQATLPLVVIGQASKMIANSAVDISHALLKGFTIHKSLKEISTQIARDLIREEISEKSVLTGYTLQKIIEKMNFSITIFGLRRDNKWEIMPDLETELQPNDVLLARGSSSSISLLKLLIGGSAEEISPPEEEEEIEETKQFENEIVNNIISLKDTSEVMVDLAYGAVLYNNRELAQLVTNMEKRLDTIRNKSELAILGLAKSSSEELSSLQGLIRIIEATEDISDSANEIAKIVLAELPSHPIIELVVGESTENIFKSIVEESSPIIGKTIPAGNYIDEYGIRVLALKRAGGYFFKPRRRTKIRVGDEIIFTGLKDACTAFQRKEEKAIEEKAAEIEASKKEAEKVVDEVAEEVAEEISHEKAREVTQKTASEVSENIEKVAMKAASELAESISQDITEKESNKLASRISKEVISNALKTLNEKIPDLKEKEIKKKLQNEISENLSNLLKNLQEQLGKSTDEAITKEFANNKKKIVNTAKKAATESASKEVEPVVKEAVKTESEKAAKKAAAEAIKEAEIVEEPKKMVAEVATSAAKETADKSAEKVITRSNRRAASKAAEEAAKKAAMTTAEKIARKAAKKSAKKTIQEVNVEKEFREVAEKTAQKIIEKFIEETEQVDE
ncbi:MAG: TrkA C-terminal domain-containing protein [Asgard group archaeon]|nr:TrkA C-terminal domain-containing protein [Asgard group archaeon]